MQPSKQWNVCLSNIAHQQNGPTNWLKTTEKVQINFCCSSLHFFGEGMHFMQVVTVRCHFFQAHAFRTLVTLIFLTKQLQKHFLRKKSALVCNVKLFLRSRFVLFHLFHQRLFVREDVTVPLGNCALVAHPDLLSHLDTYATHAHHSHLPEQNTASPVLIKLTRWGMARLSGPEKYQNGKPTKGIPVLTALDVA